MVRARFEIEPPLFELDLRSYGGAAPPDLACLQVGDQLYLKNFRKGLEHQRQRCEQELQEAVSAKEKEERTARRQWVREKQSRLDDDDEMVTVHRRESRSPFLQGMGMAGTPSCVYCGGRTKRNGHIRAVPRLRCLRPRCCRSFGMPGFDTRGWSWCTTCERARPTIRWGKTKANEIRLRCSSCGATMVDK